MSQDYNQDMQDLLHKMEKKENRKKFKILIFSFLPALLGLLVLSVVLKQIDQKATVLKQLKDSAKILKTSLRDLQKFKIGVGSSYLGWDSIETKNASTDQIITRIDDKIAYDSIPRKSTAPVTIYYYSKNETDNMVVQLLQKNGYKTEILKPKENMDGYKTNCMWFGQVSKEDIKKVSQYLIEAGIEIKAVKRFTNENVNKNIIAIGSVKKYNSLPIIKQQELNYQKMY